MPPCIINNFQPSQKWSHVAMTRDASRSSVAGESSRSARFDAIIVPASRGENALDGAAQLALHLDVTLVALCSRDTRVDAVAERLGHRSGRRALVVDVPEGHRHELLPQRTAAEKFRAAAAHRRSDLSLKRNLGLLLARLHGWGKILFLDDDIRVPGHPTPLAIPAATARLLAADLDVRQIAGLRCPTFPDNSVVCHARRLAGLPQDTFVSGATLGVNCNDKPVPFFPDQYNEDWFFFSAHAAQRDLGLVGNATQEPYNPYVDPQRAREEEFGDLLAEGLYALFEQQPAEMGYDDRVEAADELYWKRFTQARSEMLDETKTRLMTTIQRSRNVVECSAAINSIKAAKHQLSQLSPAICAEFVQAWTADMHDWQQATQKLRSTSRTADVLNFLDLDDWHSVGLDDLNKAMTLTTTS